MAFSSEIDPKLGLSVLFVAVDGTVEVCLKCSQFSYKELYIYISNSDIEKLPQTYVVSRSHASDVWETICHHFIENPYIWKS